MDRIWFEVETYEINVARELEARIGGQLVKFPAYIVCRGMHKKTGTKYYASIYFLADESPAPDNWFSSEYKRGIMLVPRWQFEWYVDLLRNEKPIYCYIESERPNYSGLSTGAEPVGEEEIIR